MSILLHLQQSLPSLSKAEIRIAQVILDTPDIIVNMTTAELARMAKVSDPMISRFCRRLGCISFPDFKVQLAKSLAANISFVSKAVSPGDDASVYIDKRINANQAALEFIRSKLNPADIEAAVQLLGNAEKIEIFGMGGSAAIAQDALHKLFRMGTPTTAYSDQLIQRMSAAAATETTVLLLFSFTGRTSAMVEIATIARHQKANIIAITPPGSPLSQQADITIDSGEGLEDTTVYIPMTTRIAILTIIDILATGIALSKGTAMDTNLRRIKHSLDNTKI